MTEEEQATGGYVICGKPYTIGDDQGDWFGSFYTDGFEITNEIHVSMKEEELIESAHKQIRALILKAMEKQ